MRRRRHPRGSTRRSLKIHPPPLGDFPTRGGLDVAQRELISLVAIAAIGATTQLRPHVAGAIRAGSSRQKVAAALVQVMPYIGGPYALSGLVLVARYDESASAEAYR